MTDTPVVTVNGQDIKLYDKSDARRVFNIQGFEEDDQVEEWVVDTIDIDFSYHNGDEHYVIHAHVYFQPLDAVESGYVKDDKLTLDGWVRRDNTLGGNTMGITYEKTVE